MRNTESNRLIRKVLCYNFEYCKNGITFASEKYPVVTERLREKGVAHKCRLRRTIFCPFDYFFQQRQGVIGAEVEEGVEDGEVGDVA